MWLSRIQLVTVSMSGQPSSYNPGTTYTLQISVSGNGNGGFSPDANKGTLTQLVAAWESWLLRLILKALVQPTPRAVTVAGA